MILYGEYTLNRSLIQIRGGFAYLLAYISARICTVPYNGGKAIGTKMKYLFVNNLR